MTFSEFLNIMTTLLSENGCPWDREQTHESLRQYLLEECYEAIEAINQKDMAALKEELGDVLLQVVFHAKLAEKAGAFDIYDVVEGIGRKIVSRHTHVFGSDKADTPSDVLKVWEANKRNERKRTPAEDMIDVPKSLPALVRASIVVSRSEEPLPGAEELADEIINKMERIVKSSEQNIMLNEEFGQIMLLMVKFANILEINAEFSLTNALEAFINTNSA